MHAFGSKKSTVILVGFLVVLLTGYSVWRRYHSTGLRIGKVRALAEAGRFEEANTEIERLELGLDGGDSEYADEIRDLRAKVLLEQGRQWLAWNDTSRSRKAFREVVRLAPESEYAESAAGQIWMEMRNIDIKDARYLFDIAFRSGRDEGLSFFRQWDSYYFRKPIYKLMDMVPDRYGYSGSWDWGDPFTVLELIEAALADGSLEKMGDGQLREFKVWRFQLLLYTGSFDGAMEALRELMPDCEIPEDINFFAGNYDDYLSNPSRTDLGELTFVRQLRAAEGEESGTIILRADYEGRPLAGLVGLLQEVDGSNVSFGSSSFSGGFGLHSYSEWPRQVVFSGVTDEHGVLEVPNVPPGDYRWRFYMSNRALDPEWPSYRTTFEKKNEISLEAGDTYENPFSVRRQYLVEFVDADQLLVLGEEPLKLHFRVDAPSGADYPRPEELSFRVSLTDRSEPHHSVGLGGNLKLAPGVFEFGVTEALEGFDRLKDSLLDRRDQSGPFCLLDPNITVEGNEYSVDMRLSHRPKLLMWLGTPPAEYAHDPVMDYWAYLIRDRFDPDSSDDREVRGGIPELLRQHPKSALRCWLKLYLAMSYWHTRETEKTQLLLEELLLDPLAQGPIARVARKALADVTHGKPLPSNWWFQYERD